MMEQCESVVAPYYIYAFSLSAQMKSGLPFQLFRSLVSPTVSFSYSNLCFKSRSAFEIFPPCASVFNVFNLKTHCLRFPPCVLSYLRFLSFFIQLV